MKRLAGWFLTAACVVVVASCSSSGAGTPAPVAGGGAASPATAASSGPAPTASVEQPSAAPASVVPPPSAAPSAAAFTKPSCNGTIRTPVTPFKASLTQTYDTSKAPFDASKVGGLGPDSVNVQWFRGSGGTWIAWYVGLCNATAAVCPGNSIKVGSAFQDVSNSPAAPGGCTGDEEFLATPPAGLQVCNGAFFMYVTKIPNTAKGTLYASVEKGQPDGSIVGITSTVETSAGPKTGPTLDLSTFSCAPAA